MVLDEMRPLISGQRLKIVGALRIGCKQYESGPDINETRAYWCYGSGDMGSIH